MGKRESNIVKGIGIIMMLAFHLFYDLGTVYRRGGAGISCLPFTLHELSLLVAPLKACVALFVLVTAYGTYVQLEHRGISGGRECSAYIVEHLVKLLAGFWVVFGLAAVVSLAIPSHCIFEAYPADNRAQALSYFLVDLFGLARLFGTPTFNATWWYMSVAVLLVVLAPALTIAARGIGSVGVLVLSFGLPMILDVPMKNELAWYLPTAAMGIVLAQSGALDRLSSSLGDGRARRAGLALGLLLAGLALAFARQRVYWYWLFDALIAADVAGIAVCLGPLAISRPLQILGAYSMNMFLVHTFLYAYFFSWAFYSMPWFGLAIAWLVVASLAVSWGIERLKRLLGFSGRVASLGNRLARGLDWDVPGQSG